MPMSFVPFNPYPNPHAVTSHIRQAYHNEFTEIRDTAMIVQDSTLFSKATQGLSRVFNKPWLGIGTDELEEEAISVDRQLLKAFAVQTQDITPATWQTLSESGYQLPSLPLFYKVNLPWFQRTDENRDKVVKALHETLQNQPKASQAFRTIALGQVSQLNRKKSEYLVRFDVSIHTNENVDRSGHEWN